MLTQDAILNALKNIKYPGYMRDIVSFGLVKNVQVSADSIEVHIQLTSGKPEVAQQIELECVKAIEALPGAPKARVIVASAGAPSGPASPFAGQTQVPGVKRIIAVASGKGGVGKSTCSVNLACALAHLGNKVGLLDCDIYGPSIPLMMGIHEVPTVENEMLVPPMQYGIKLMSIGFLIEGDAPVIWRGPMIVKTIQQFLMQVKWAELDYLIVDMPPGTGDAQLTLCQTVPLHGGVIVTTPQEASLGVVRKGIGMFEKVNVPVLGLIENMSYYITPTGDRVEIFGHGGGRSEAEKRKIPFLGEVPIFTEIREGGDRGLPVVVSAPTQPPGQAFLRIAEALQKGMK
jgi:ATP-binding protein involved in chromosome partitioning